MLPTNASPRTKAGDRTSKNHGSSANMAYQITDLMHCLVPEGSSIVTATVRCCELNLSLNPTALYHKLLSGEGKVICMTQLSPDSWMLLGYRRDNVVSGVFTREGLTPLSADRMSSSPRDAATNDINLPDDGDEEDKEGSGEYRAHGASSGLRLSKANVRFRKRTRVPWLESGGLQLLAYRDDMEMGWGNIFEHFPGRTPGAVRARWHMLSEKYPAHRKTVRPRKQMGTRVRPWAGQS
ncbi:hypothetical protein GQ44DRAFT_438986 [Phaeosphaeriaceae sp. PMI808]|nr:hypothetical protein GQ44DRAFT_438986 [Phaeosphaeriaceae sp. PMI808]